MSFLLLKKTCCQLQAAQDKILRTSWSWYVIVWISQSISLWSDLKPFGEETPVTFTEHLNSNSVTYLLSSVKVRVLVLSVLVYSLLLPTHSPLACACYISNSFIGSQVTVVRWITIWIRKLSQSLNGMLYTSMLTTVVHFSCWPLCFLTRRISKSI